MTWIVSVPVWGSEYTDTFLKRTLPALTRAAARAKVRVGLVIHTDRHQDIRTNIDTLFRQVPNGITPFDAMSLAHKEALAIGQRGDYVMLLTADMLISEETFEYCEGLFALKPVGIVCVPGLRTDLACVGERTESGRALLNWGWAYRHPIIIDATWPYGRANDLSRMFFESGATVVSRQALPHPLVVRVDGRALPFRPTIDSNLVCNFGEHEVHLVTDGAIAAVELSPRDKDTATSHMAMRDRVMKGLVSFRLMAPRSWLLRQRIVIQGDDIDCGDDVVVGHMLRNVLTGA